MIVTITDKIPSPTAISQAENFALALAFAKKGLSAILKILRKY